MSLVVEKEIIRVISNQPERLVDKIIKETPYALIINGREIVNFVCTPEYIKDLAIGYIYSQGLINSINQIVSIELIDGNIVDILLKEFSDEKYHKKIMTSGERSLKLKREHYDILEYDVSVEKTSPKDIYELAVKLYDASKLHAETGGVHNAALSSFDNQFFEFRKDIGRHNAADKLIGYCLKNNISMKDKILVFSGRISSEIIKKVAKARIPMIVSVSAPTDLAVAIAEKVNITLVGFVRGEKMNIYNDCGRIHINW